ncbi:Chemotaxis protein methyltransferase [bioreactor metagenome]|uniref:Chemotaxis protein methyltransferase n=1 Tax=bioreactor metagenome TaxID=1076179 RepID=A0A644Z7S2_9ZZZZ
MDPINFKIPFDVIFCRNVMIYFDQQTKEGLIERFYKATNSGGYLLIGHSETLNKNTSKYTYIMPATYKKL